jgi:hypothetical protein
MSLFELVLLIIALGVALYCAKKYIPMDDSLKQILTVVVVIAVVYICLVAFGVIDYIRGIHVGKMR